MVKRIRVIVLSILVTAGAASLFAAPDHEILHEFYPDDTYTEPCGFWYYNCTGQWQKEGCFTQYVISWDGHDC
jgi:hypothetical protein